MSAYDNNQILLPLHKKKIILEALVCDANKLSVQYNKIIQSEPDYEIFKYHNEFIKVALGVNPLGIGVVPYEYRIDNQIYTDTDRRGFTDIATKDIIYINKNIDWRSIKRVALHELIHLLKYLVYDDYAQLLAELKTDDAYVSFCNSRFNLRLLEECNYPKSHYEDETLANFYTQNLNNKKIPIAFFDEMIYNEENNIDLAVTPYNTKKYFKRLMVIIYKLK